jgi:hypothetical protein
MEYQIQDLCGDRKLALLHSEEGHKRIEDLFEGKN